ncbi:MAG: Txe/YoeB family addiction module toxin [Bacteroidetes bacterium HGW-Bacteroidetes-12]|jgi:toxin YoeB|nr:MAG: Txe/YoeB family addiction module toxin [Bacteroidetes bacterium HGW-Bacteroidetes-12]
MGKFRLKIEKAAQIDIKKHYKFGNKPTIKKLEQILKELSDHPTTGTGQPEQLKHELAGKWSRRINQKDSMIYTINNNTVTVQVLSAMGHYLDK